MDIGSHRVNITSSVTKGPQDPAVGGQPEQDLGSKHNDTDRAYFAHSGQNYTHDTDHIISPTRTPITFARMRRYMYHGKVRPSQLALQFGLDGGEFLRRQRLLRPLDAESLLF